MLLQEALTEFPV